MNKHGTPENLSKFKLGDKRINRRGRPKNFDTLRDLAKQIAHESVTQKDGNERTITELILRRWAGSNDARLQIQFMEIAFGKVPVLTEHKGKIPTESIVRHAISGETAESIFDILAAAGAFDSVAADIEIDETDEVFTKEN